MSFNLQEYFDELTKGKVILAYQGEISTEIINSLLEKAEKELINIDESSKIRKRIYNIMVESLQNLFHHADDIPEDFKIAYDEKFGMIVVAKYDDHYKVTTGNYIKSDKIKFLKDKIDKINSLSQEELKEMYKFILNHQKLSAKGGGGLGLVDIARKTKKKMEYNFLNHDNEYYFFSFSIII
jgi:hypothetical protein